MENSVEARLEKYVKENLSPSPVERRMVSDRYQELGGILKGTVFQSGSYPRFTATTPVNDLDVIWELPENLLQVRVNASELRKTIDPREINVSKILHDLALRVGEEYKNLGETVRIKVQSHSVGIYFGESDDDFSIDLVPAIPTGEANEFGDPFYLVPDVVLMNKAERLAKYAEARLVEWIKSDPLGYRKAAELLNEQTGTYRKTAKIVKTWKRACKSRDEKFGLKSFHLDIITQDILSRDTSLNGVEALQHIFTFLPECTTKPRYQDRANPDQYIDANVEEFDDEIRRLIQTEIAQATTLINQLVIEQDPDKAELLIKRLVGKDPVQPPSGWTAPAVSRPYYEDHQ